MSQFVGIDLGTSSVKVVVVDSDDRVVASATRTYPIDTPYPGAAEQNPEVWWLRTCACLREVMDADGVDATRIGAIGLCGQMHGLVALDADRTPVRPAIIWPDTRSAPQCEQLDAALAGESLHDTTGVPATTGLLGPSLMWLRDNEPRDHARIDAVILPKDYVRLRLTAELATDPTDASGTLLYDTVAGRWSERVVGAAGLDLAMLPAVRQSHSVAGTVTATAAASTGLPAGTPVVAGAGDQMAGAIAIGVSKPGTTASVIGTGGQLITTATTPLIDSKHRLQTFVHAMPASWLLMGAVLSAALSFDWLAGILHASWSGGAGRNELLAEAARVPAGSDGLIFLPYLNGVRTPHLDPTARGCFVGLGLEHSRGHLVRAVLEGVAYAMRDGLTALEDLGIDVGEIICSGGGARIPLWRQIQADVYRRPVSVVAEGEHSAFGAAIMAGVGGGRFTSLEEAATHRLPTVRTTPPSPAAADTYDEIYAAATALYFGLRPTFASLVALRGTAAAS